MEGLIEEKKSNYYYLNIIGGRFAHRETEHLTDGKGGFITEERVYKDNNDKDVTVIERYFKGVEGEIQEAKFENSEFGTKIILIISKGGNDMHISFRADSSYGRSFMFRAPNINPNKQVTLKPYNFEQKDDNGNVVMNKSGKAKKVIGISVWQEGCGWEKDKVPAKWDSESPELPSWEVTTVMGKEKWNNDKQMDFLATEFDKWTKTLSDINPVEKMKETLGLEEAADSVDAVMQESTNYAKREEQPHKMDDLGSKEPDDLPF
jgi:hypothetical protein